jgi:hypothetical protein
MIPFRLKLTVIGFILAGFPITGCVRHLHGGSPALPLSDTNGTQVTFEFSDRNLLTAITNAFRGGKYRAMIFGLASEFPYRTPNQRQTNGFVLLPMFGPITNVPLNGRQTVYVPYTPSFYIRTIPLNSSNTTLIVLTAEATVIDGEESGIHGGWANHIREVSPVRSEEVNVINAITEALMNAQ